MKCWTASFCIHAIKGPIIIMDQLKSIYNRSFKYMHSDLIHTCLATIASNGHKKGKQVGKDTGIPGVCTLLLMLLLYSQIQFKE